MDRSVFSINQRIRNLMYTYMAVVALAASVSNANLSRNPTWLDDYGIAQKRVASIKKPMAVFVGNGKEGWESVVRDGGLDPAVNKLLAEKYVCVYVNTDTAEGRALAGRFEVASRGLIISDRKGTSQAYSLSGSLTKAELVKTLEQYADQNGEVRNTETVVREAPPARPAYAPQYYVPQYYPGPVYRTGGG
jgi:hypothetical protein